MATINENNKGGNGGGGGGGGGGGSAAFGDAVARTSGSIPSLPFNGDKADFKGWAMMMEAWAWDQDLHEVLTAPIKGRGQASCASVIGAEDDDEVKESEAGSVADAEADKAFANKTKKANRMYLVILCNLKSREVLAQIADVPKGNAHEVWTRLKRYYGRNTQANRHQLMAELYNMRQKQGETVAVYAARVRELVLSLNDLDERTTPAQMTFTFANGLSSAFQHLVTMLTHLGGGFEATVDAVLAEETRILLNQSQGKSAPPRDQESAHYAAGAPASSSSGRSTQPFTGECYRCHKTGHRKQDCNMPAPTCKHCGKTGHTIGVCWELHPSKKPAQMAANSNTARGPAAAAMAVDTIATAFVARVEPTAAAAGSGTGWYMDSGASAHFAADATRLVDKTESNIKIRVASGELLEEATIGKVVLKVDSGAVSLSKVLSHPKMSSNLMSVGAICDAAAARGDEETRVIFQQRRAEVRDGAGKLLLSASRVPGGGLYVVNERAEEANGATTEVQQLWHQRLGHLSESGMKALRDAKAVDGFDDSAADPPPCAGCMRGKAHREAFGSSVADHHKAAAPLARLLSDECGPMLISLGGAQHMLLVIDEYSRKVWAFFLRFKSEATVNLVALCRALEAQKGSAVVEFHSDNGGEFLSKELLHYFSGAGTAVTTTIPHTPQHNGIVERMNRTIMEAARSMMMQATAHPMMWAEAAATAVFLHNHATLRTGGTKTPEALWMGREVHKLNINKLHVWGCDAWRHIPDSTRSGLPGGKLEGKAVLGMFVGYEPSRLGYRILDVDTRKIIISRDVRFDDTAFTQSKRLLEEEGGQDTLQGFSDNLDRIMWDNETKLVEMISKEEHDKAKAAAQPAQPVESSGGARSSCSAPIAASADPPAAGSAAVGRKVTFKLGGVPVDQLQVAKESSNAGAESNSGPGPAAGPAGGAAVGASAAAASISTPAASGGMRSRAGRLIVPVNRQGMVADEDIGLCVQALAAVAFHGTDPRNYQEAMNSDKKERWQEAMDTELKSLQGHDVFKVVSLPEGRKAIGSRWIYLSKLDRMGAVDRHKARLVAKGYAQVEGVDAPSDLFAPVLHYKSLRVILAIVAKLDYELLQLDVPTAFLNAACKEDVYMKIPAGMEVKTSIANPVLKLEKTLYGIVQAPRSWNLEFDGSIIDLGYKRCSTDTCVYVKKSKTGKSMIIPVFVDDVFPACATEDLVELRADLARLMAKYKIKELNEANVVLGMRITRDRKARTLKLDQEIYINKMLQQHGMADCNGAPTPELERSTKQAGATAEQSSDSNSSITTINYGSGVGGIMYAAQSTRPDIAHAAGVRAAHVGNPSAADALALKRVLRYLKATASMGLVFGSGSDGSDDGNGAAAVTIAPAFCDADWAGDTATRRSTTGYVMKVCGSTVSWASKKQATVSLSSAESEYMAAGAATQEIIWLRALLGELGWPQTEATTLQCDNQPAIAIASDDVHHARTKHIDIRHHFIREHIRSGALRMQWVSTQQQQADILTKALGPILFTRFRSRVLGDAPQVSPEHAPCSVEGVC